jgi:hypothetical protein
MRRLHNPPNNLLHIYGWRFHATSFAPSRLCASFSGSILAPKRKDGPLFLPQSHRLHALAAEVVLNAAGDRALGSRHHALKIVFNGHVALESAFAEAASGDIATSSLFRLFGMFGAPSFPQRTGIV